MPSPAEVAAALARIDSDLALYREWLAGTYDEAMPNHPTREDVGVIATAVRDLTAQRDSYKAAYDELNVRLAGVEAERDHVRGVTHMVSPALETRVTR